MVKKKSSQQSGVQDPAQATSKPKASEASSSTLVICCNRQTLAVHILLPWAMAPIPEVLGTLENSTHTAPRPHPIDISVFFGLVKIRKAVDEATNLAVRAASGVTSAPLSSSLNASNGMINSAGAAALGLGFGGNSSGPKLSRSCLQVIESRRMVLAAEHADTLSSMSDLAFTWKG